MSKIVYIVHHVDTEGPLFESVEATFQRLEEILGEKIDIAPIRENLEKIYTGRYKLKCKNESDITNILDPHLLSYNDSWEKIDEMLAVLCSEKFRNAYQDSFGGFWKFNWHIMDHVGYSVNPRKRELGYLKIFDHYRQALGEYGYLREDEIHWHFHPVSFKREAHKCATSYENSFYELSQIITRRLIERQWFPRVNRAGFHAVRPDSAFFLEQWMPFDASNQSVASENTGQTDANWGRFGDWNGAPDDWSLYNPDYYDWRIAGNARRFVSRVLNLRTRFRNITVPEIEKAFQKSDRENQAVYLGVTNHDFRDMRTEIDDFYKKLLQVSSKYNNVKFKFSTAVEAFRKVIGYDDETVKSEAVDFVLEMEDNLLKIKITNGEPFGPQPYLALKTVSGEYYHDNFDFGEFKKEYYYTFDTHTFPLEEIDSVGVACNDIYGNCRIAILKPKTNTIEKFKL